MIAYIIGCMASTEMIEGQEHREAISCYRIATQVRRCSFSNTER